MSSLLKVFLAFYAKNRLSDFAVLELLYSIAASVETCRTCNCIIPVQQYVARASTKDTNYRK